MNELQRKILQLKAERGVFILAHNYVIGEVQDIADYVGDSLELSRRAAEVKAEVTLFCGVRFMGETAKILSPSSIVLLPAPDADCPMARMADPAAVTAARQAHPDAIFVAYVNSTADVKAEIDVCCTSGNAARVVAALPGDREIVFLPDGNLGRNIAGGLGRSLTFWPGCCPIHDRVTVAMIEEARRRVPGAPVLVHPECRPEVTAASDAALSTGGMLKYVAESPEQRFVIGTESGLLHRLIKENPGKEFFTLKPELICADMKKITLENVLAALENFTGAVELPEELCRKAAAPIHRMLEL